MKYTNYSELPQPIADRIANPSYTKGHADYSITQLLKPPRATALEYQHRDELEMDVSDGIWALLGTLMHELLDRAETESIPRDRMYTELAGKIVSGATDRFVLKNGLLQDYKLTSVWKVKHSLKEFDEDWAAQLNGYALLLNVAGINVQKAEIVAVMRDWHKSKAIESEFYPQRQVLRLPAPLWSFEATKAFFEYRVRLHEKAKQVLPLCTPEERWASADSWAVHKGNAARAVKLYDNESDAKNHAESSGEPYTVKHRPGESKRCGQYCLASKFCSQYLETVCSSSLPWPSQA